jgi:His/Glu/Gln/Arg/opine family amino acid ABC transporter permease subunit
MNLDFATVFALWPAFLKGTLVTIALTLSILVISTPSGFLVAFARNARNPLISVPFLVASWITRGIPPLLLLLIVFFIPAQYGFKIPSFISATIAMSLYMSFYFGEVFRGGLASIDRGQYEAGDALGLSSSRIFVRVILPQLLPVVTPSYISHSSTLLKNTALASAVAVQELTGIAKDLFAVTYRPFETLLVVAIIYGLISALLFVAQGSVERRWAKDGAR